MHAKSVLPCFASKVDTMINQLICWRFFIPVLSERGVC